MNESDMSGTAHKPASIKELRSQLEAQLPRNLGSLESATERETELRDQIAATTRLAINDPNEMSCHWLTVRPGDRIEQCFTPPIARTELESRYPGAVLIPLPNTSRDPIRPTSR